MKMKNYPDKKRKKREKPKKGKECRFNSLWSMCKHNANSGTKEGIRSEA